MAFNLSPFFVLAQKAGFEPALRLSHTTPLAGEPLEPLGYFCNVSKEKFSISCFNAILLYHISIEKSKLFTRPNQKFRVKNRKNEKFFFQSVVSLDFLTNM